MSYDYTAAVRSFAEARRAAEAAADADSKLKHVQEAVETVESSLLLLLPLSSSSSSSSQSPQEQQQQQQHGTKNNNRQQKPQPQCSPCPLTPLLWMHYAATVADYCRLCSTPSDTADVDAAAAAAAADSNRNNNNLLMMSQQQQQQQLELQTLQLGLTEFPGSALLQLRTVVVQLEPLFWQLQNQQQQQQQQQQQHASETAEVAAEAAALVEQAMAAVQSAIHAVGQGSHRNEDCIVVVLYRIWAALAIMAATTTATTAAATTTTTITTTPNDDTINNNQQHLNSGDWVQVQQQQQQQQQQAVADIFVQRSRIPMKEANQKIMAELRQQLQMIQLHFYQLPPLPLSSQSASMSTSLSCKVTAAAAVATQTAAQAAAIETGRRWEAKVYSRFAAFEDAIDVALHRDGVMLARIQPEFRQQQPQQQQEQQKMNNRGPFSSSAAAIAAAVRMTTTDDDNDCNNNNDERKSSNNNNIFSNSIKACWEHIDWDVVLRSGDQTYGMGLGSIDTAKLFVEYARALKQFKLASDVATTKTVTAVDDDDNGDDHHHEDHNDGNDSSNMIEISSIHALALAVYERGVAECPCIEYLWLAYIRDLQQWMQQAGQQQGHEEDEERTQLAVAAASRLQQVTARAVRNCPYSVALLQQKLVAVLLLASSSTTSHTTVVDPDQLLDMVQEGLDSRFLPNSPAVALDLYFSAIRIVKRRILILLASRVPPNKPVHKTKNPRKTVYYDDGEPLPNKNNNPKSKATNRAKQVAPDNDDDDDDEDTQEVKDLLADIGDMYDEVESRLRKSAASWTEGRALLWKERAQTEALLLNPLHEVFGGDKEPARPQQQQQQPGGDDIIDQLLQSLEKCIRAHNPPHPDSYAVYIRQYMAAITSVRADSAEEVLFRIRRARGLFEKAIGAVGKSNAQELAHSSAAQPSSLPFRDYETALVSLCYEWVDFERIFGSERSLGKASKAVEKKLHKAARFCHGATHHTQHPTAAVQAREETPANSETECAKRPHHGDDADFINNESVARPTKKAKIDALIESTDVPMPIETGPTETLKAADSVSKSPDSKSVPKVRFGNMDYPAHPFTVRVSNLSLDTEDMDLVDTFRPKCGAIVHAKIIRDKHQQQQHGKGKSKGWGLIQFERCESVETALALDDTLGIHEKLVKVDRSHMPATSVVPPGMHRVRPKGEGKVSKRNQKRRDRNMSEDNTGADRADEPTQDEEAKADLGSSIAIPKNPPNEPKKVINVTSALAFRPRTVGRGSHQKPRLKLDGGSSKSADT